MVATACAGLCIGYVHDGTAQASRRPARVAAIKTPEWYDKIPSDSAHLVARGTGKSRDQQVAVDKATAAARASLAKSIELQWSRLMAAIQKESGARRSGPTEPVTLLGSTVTQQQIAKRGKIWTAFVLVAVPRESVHTVLVQRLHSNEEWYSSVKHSKAVLEFEAYEN
jgi:hypothetical protein